jgi:uncharacterized membrane protein YhaH (DUF805 family)
MAPVGVPKRRRMPLPETRPATLQPAASEPEDDLRALLLGFAGRLPRKAFWLYGVIGLSVAQFLIYALLGIAGMRERTADVLAALVIAWPSLAISVKRWHDRDKSGWWMLINLVPVVGLVWTLVECGALRGTVGANRFGADPLQRR